MAGLLPPDHLLKLKTGARSATSSPFETLSQHTPSNTSPIPAHASAISGLGSIIPMFSSSLSDSNVDGFAEGDVPRRCRRWRSMLLMLRVESDCVVRIEEGEEDREEVVERWKGGGRREKGVGPMERDISIDDEAVWWEYRLGGKLVVLWCHAGERWSW